MKRLTALSLSLLCGLSLSAAGVLSCAPTNVASFANTKSLSLDGVSQYVQFGHFFEPQLGDKWFFAMWVNHTTGMDLLTSRSSSSNPNGGIQVTTGDTSTQIIWDQDNSKFFFGNFTTGIGSSSVWHHIAGQYDGSGAATGLKVWIDGVATTRTTTVSGIVGAITYTDTIAIGRKVDNSFWQGLVDEPVFAIGYSTVFSDADVAALYGAGHAIDVTKYSRYTSLTSWFRFGDLSDSASTTFDRIGGNNGTLVNSPPYSSTVP